VRLVGHVTPAYALRRGAGVIIRRGEVDTVLYVEKVDRPWREGEAQNGVAPCLVHLRGEPYPWYFQSGHEYVTELSEMRGFGDD
jgi:hypothetical protein